MQTNPLLQSVQLALQNATQKEALVYIDKVVDFCIEKENGKVLDGWPRDLIQLLVAYHMAKDTLIVEQDKDDNVLGVGMWYNCNEDADWFFIQNWEPDTKDSNAVFIGFLHAASKCLFKKMTYKFLSICPGPLNKKVIMMRHRNGHPTRIESSYRLFNKILTI